MGFFSAFACLPCKQRANKDMQHWYACISQTLDRMPCLHACPSYRALFPDVPVYLCNWHVKRAWLKNIFTKVKCKANKPLIFERLCRIMHLCREAATPHWNQPHHAMQRQRHIARLHSTMPTPHMQYSL